MSQWRHLPSCPFRDRFKASYTTPFSALQNRQSAKDRRRAEADYAVNLRAELDVSAVHARLDELSGRQWAALLELQRQQLELLSRIETLTGEVHRAMTPTRDAAGASEGQAVVAVPASSATSGPPQGSDQAPSDAKRLGGTGQVDG